MHAEHADSARLSDLSGQVTGCVFTMLRDAGLVVGRQRSIKVRDHRAAVGEYNTDLLAKACIWPN
jgi:hypothetical protein